MKYRTGQESIDEAEERVRKAALTRATRLDLGQLGLTMLPPGLRKLTMLRELILSHNELIELPFWLNELDNLELLNLSKNFLSALPAWRTWTKLVSLHVFENHLTALPDAIGKWGKLRELSAFGNRLAALPESLGEQVCLEDLDLSFNELSSLPESLRMLTRLKKLDLRRNPSLGLSPAVLRGTPTEIFDSYFRMRAESRPFNEAKLIIVGRGGVGKTSLVNRLLHDTFNSQQATTDGICISEWRMWLRGDQIRLNLWDFGGQEIMHATHQFFLTQRSLYLLVLEGRKGGEDADAEYWLKLIESFGTDASGEESPVIIALNKQLENPFDLNFRALRQKFPFVREFVKTDCADGTNIRRLRTAIEAEADRLTHVRDRVPVTWFAIRNRLAGMKKEYGRSFISFQEYRNICDKNGETQAVAQDSLAAYLHNLGIVINYKDDPRLRDTHVLDPHWVTNGIYAIINSSLLFQRRGDIRLKDVERLLSPTDYPPELHPFLFDLMRKFQLCFSFPDDEHHYLIPDLLDKQESLDATTFRSADCLRFEYHYPILPEGLLPRFIVRTHTLSIKSPRWRTGVVLEFEGNRALVKADVQDRRILISVDGPQAGRRRLLAVVRSDLESIHSTISRLRPQAMIPVRDQPPVTVSYAKLLAFEAAGIRKFHEVVDHEVIELDVQDLLNGVDMKHTRQAALPSSSRPPVRLFYVYASRDLSLREELETHLKLLERQHLISGWHDGRLDPGANRSEAMDENLQRADIILFLLSADFFGSDETWSREVSHAMARQQAGDARVIPVLLRPVAHQGTPFEALRSLPSDGTPVTEWSSRDRAWQDVSEGIARVVNEIHAERAPKSGTRR